MGFLRLAMGLFSAEDRKKALWVRDCNPGADVRIEPLSQDQSQRETDLCPRNASDWLWAERNGFKWADRFVPEEWLQEY